MVDTPANQNQKLTIPLCCIGDSRATGPFSWTSPSHTQVLPWRSGNTALLERSSVGSALVEPRLETTETIVLNKSVLQGIEIVSCELSGNVSHSLLSSGPQITVGLKALFSSYLYYLLDHFVFLLFSLPSLTHQIFVGLILGAVSDIHSESVILLLFFFPPSKM